MLEYEPKGAVGLTEPLAEAVMAKMRLRGPELTDDQVMELCENEVFRSGRTAFLCSNRKYELIRQVFCTLRRDLEIIQDLADDPEITEIMVNGCEGVFAEKFGRSFKVPVCFESRTRLEQVIQRLAARVGREFNELNPILDARLADGSRINAVNTAVALNGPVLTIRKFTKNRMSMKELTDAGDISLQAAELLQLLTRTGYNIFVCGGTSSGKTTFLNVLSDFIPPEERIIVIEDSAELQIRGHENLVRLEAKNPNAQGRGSVSIRELIRSSLRMRPDRIIVGEVRGAEVNDMLTAMTTGHDGSLSTGHANSPEGMMRRLETMALSGGEYSAEAIRGQISEAIEIVVHLTRGNDGRRRVTDISELLGIEGSRYVLNKLFSFDPQKDVLVRTGELKNTVKLIMKGGHDGLQRIYTG